MLSHHGWPSKIDIGYLGNPKETGTPWLRAVSATGIRPTKKGKVSVPNRLLKESISLRILLFE